MIYENVDEVAKREACERVKQIVKAIKAIKIKYYLNFSKMTAEDQETYKKLEANLEKISADNSLDNLKVALMSEVDAKYDDKKDFGNNENSEHHDPDEILQACYGAIDAQKEALSKGKISQALRCQEQLKKYMESINLPNYKDMIVNYKREKFAELGRTREEMKKQMDKWNRKMKGTYKIEDASKRKDVMGIVTQVQDKEPETEKGTEELTI